MRITGSQALTIGGALCFVVGAAIAIGLGWALIFLGLGAILIGAGRSR
jgi:hypothetical protein